MLNGPILFMTNDLRAPACLSSVAQFAEASSRELRILARMPGRTEPVIFKKRLEIFLDSLPDSLKDLPVAGVMPKEFRSALQSYADEHGGLIVLLPMRRGNPVRIVANNDYERLLIEGPLPILALPRDGQLTPVRKLLFPADFSPRSEAIFEQAVALCHQFGAELHILHIYGPDGLLPSEQDRERRAAAKSPRELFQMDQAIQQSLVDRATAEGLVVVNATAEGRAHQQILQYIKAQQIDLAVMATHGPRSSEDILWGSTTARVIQAGTVAVLAVQC